MNSLLFDFYLTQGKEYVSKGCWTDKQDAQNPRAITNIDGDIDESYNNGHPYRNRLNPKENCLDAALSRELKFFALQDGGECWGTNEESKYKKYGSVTCQAEWDGQGYSMINHVYEILTGKFFTLTNGFTFIFI